MSAFQQQAEELINRCVQLLEDGYQLLKEKENISEQNYNDIIKGMFRKTDLYDSDSYMKCRILYEFYHIYFLETFIILFKNVSKAKDCYCLLLPFTVRSLLEMGINLIDVLFSPSASSNDKSRVKLISLLPDLAVVDSDPNFHGAYKQLYDEENNNLGNDERNIFNEIYNDLSKGQVPSEEKIKKARECRNRIVNNIMANIKSSPVLKNNIKMLYSWFSHLLHGNVFLVKDVFDSPDDWRNRLYVIMLIVGGNASFRLAEYLKDSKYLEEVLKLIDDINKFLPKFIISNLKI